LKRKFLFYEHRTVGQMLDYLFEVFKLDKIYCNIKRESMPL